MAGKDVAVGQFEDAVALSPQRPGCLNLGDAVRDGIEMLDSMRAGAVGYVLKDAANAELVGAIRRAAAGETPPTPGLGAAVAAT